MDLSIFTYNPNSIESHNPLLIFNLFNELFLSQELFGDCPLINMALQVVLLMLYSEELRDFTLVYL